MHPFFDRVTDRARRAIDLGSDYAKVHKHPLVTRLHILYGILAEDKNVAVKVLKNMKINIPKLKSDVIEAMGEGSYKTHYMAVPYNKSVCKLICVAIDSSLEVKFVACQHLLKAILMDNDDLAVLILNKAGVSLEAFEAQVESNVKSIESNKILF